MFFYALDVPAPGNEVIHALAENNVGKLILLLVILFCVAVGIVYACIIKKKKKLDPSDKEECAKENEGEK